MERLGRKTVRLVSNLPGVAAVTLSSNGMPTGLFSRVGVRHYVLRRSLQAYERISPVLILRQSASFRATTELVVESVGWYCQGEMTSSCAQRCGVGGVETGYTRNEMSEPES